MDDVKNKIGVIILGIILLIFIFGGYFLKNYMVNGMGDKTKDNTNKIIEDIRINKEKDYIYLTTNITKESMENLETSKLFIDKNSYDFNLVQFEQRNDNNYTVTIQIDELQIKENQEYVVIYLKEKDTTLFEELKKKLKEVFNEET